MIVLRPLSKWDQPIIKPERSPFSASYDSTKRIVQHEANALNDGRDVEVVVELDVDERDISRAGGSLLARRQPPTTPRVAVSFNSRYGPLRYECAKFSAWRDNLRAIGLGLESLRRLDRYGIGGRGEQYTGWTAIGSGTPMHGPMTVSAACALLGVSLHATEAQVRDAYRILAKMHHPDNGGDAAMFDRVTVARDYLIGSLL